MPNIDEQAWELLMRRLDSQDKALDEIRKQTRETNGRVNALERGRERAVGMVSAYRWVGAAFAGLISAGSTVLVLAVTGGLH